MGTPPWTVPFHYTLFEPTLLAPIGAPTAISDTGEVVGFTTTPTSDQVACRWGTGGFKLLPLLPGYTTSEARDINTSGFVVGKLMKAGGSTGFLYDPIADQLLDLNQFAPPTFAVHEARAVNAGGDLAGLHAGGGFVMYANKTFDDLGALLKKAGLTSTVIWVADINASGQITGLFDGPGGQQGFIYDTPSKRAVPFSDPGNAVRPTAINDSGEVVGIVTPPLPAQAQSFRFQYPNGPLQRITAPGGATDINNARTFVGPALPSASPAAWIQFEDQASIDLNWLIDPQSGWTLQQAISINNVGQVAGMGLYQGQQQPFLLTPIRALAQDKSAFYIHLLGGMIGLDTGGTGIDPSGHIVHGPPLRPILRLLSPAERDVLVGLAISELASLGRDERGRKAIRESALRMLQTGAASLMRSSTGERQ